MPIILDPQIEQRIRIKVDSGRYQSPSQMVAEGLDLLDKLSELQESAVPEGLPEQGDPPIRPAWEQIVALGATVPDEEWAKVPEDLSKNVDHYLYGSPKRSE